MNAARLAVRHSMAPLKIDLAYAANRVYAQHLLDEYERKNPMATPQEKAEHLLRCRIPERVVWDIVDPLDLRTETDGWCADYRPRKTKKT